jgi:hypothetical protein
MGRLSPCVCTIGCSRRAHCLPRPLPVLSPPYVTGDAIDALFFLDHILQPGFL